MSLAEVDVYPFMLLKRAKLSAEEFLEGRGRDLNPGKRLHRPLGYQATSPRPPVEDSAALDMLFVSFMLSPAVNT